MLLLFPSEHCISYKHFLLQLLGWQMNFPFTWRTAQETARHDVQLLHLLLLHWNCSRSWFLLVNTAVLRQRVPAESLGKFSTYHYKRDFDLNSLAFPLLCVQNPVDTAASSALLALAEERWSMRQRRDRRFCDTVISRVETADLPEATTATFLYYKS